MNTTSEIACINGELSLIDDSISNLLDKCDVIRFKLEKIEKETEQTKYPYEPMQPVWVREGIETYNNKWYLRYFQYYANKGIVATMDPNSKLDPCNLYAWPIHQPVYKPEE